MADRVPSWKIVLAAILDFISVFLLAGWIIAQFTGSTTATGFQLNGLPAVLLFVIVIAYFVLARRMGGTLWQRLLRARR